MQQDKLVERSTTNARINKDISFDDHTTTWTTATKKKPSSPVWNLCCFVFRFFPLRAHTHTRTVQPLSLGRQSSFLFLEKKRNSQPGSILQNFPPNGESADKKEKKRKKEKKHQHKQAGRQPPENPLTEPKVVLVCANPALGDFSFSLSKMVEALKGPFSFYSLFYFSYYTHWRSHSPLRWYRQSPSHLIPFYRPHRIRGDVRERWRHLGKRLPINSTPLDTHKRKREENSTGGNQS